MKSISKEEAITRIKNNYPNQDFELLEYVKSTSLNNLILKCSDLSFNINETKHKNTTIWDIIVASAAPITPIVGNGPTPNINIGSKIILVTSPIVFILNGDLLFPSPTNIDVNTGFIK